MIAKHQKGRGALHVVDFIKQEKNASFKQIPQGSYPNQSISCFFLALRAETLDIHYFRFVLKTSSESFLITL